MRYLILILCLLLASCQRGPVSSSLTDTPDALKHLPPGTSLDFGDLRLDIVAGDKTVVSQRKAKAEPAIKCKDCFNTDNSDRSKTKDKSETTTKDKSKTKDNSDTTVKNKPDNSQLKKAKIDKSVSMGKAYSSWFKGLLTKVLFWLAVTAVVVLLLLRYTPLARIFFILLIGAILASCSQTFCPAYDGHRKPRHKPTFLKDHGHQKYKYSDAARRAAEKTDAELYLSALKLQQ
ncbi:hypothetical protein [uncultured Pontibacter sp.]|uniref:hypothetical protein n=1 Tax=uncultured Pontibacter sp. TaxID=453356 RepID=UPI00260D702D|nr:hypothetical protein [uncultured Pontibacter sp.]